METKVLRAFFERIKEDYRIGPLHISLYAVLLGMREGAAAAGFFPVVREEVMPKAKIFGKTAYYKCMRDLAAGGYLEYRPEHYKRKRSMVCISFV